MLQRNVGHYLLVDSTYDSRTIEFAPTSLSEIQTLLNFEDRGNNEFPTVILQNQQELIPTQIITFHSLKYMTSSKLYITFA